MTNVRENSRSYCGGGPTSILLDFPSTVDCSFGGVAEPLTIPPGGSWGPELPPPQPAIGMTRHIIVGKIKPHFEKPQLENDGGTGTYPSKVFVRTKETLKNDRIGMQRRDRPA